MNCYENIVANWIKQKNEQGKDYHVLYRVTPIYDGENEIATEDNFEIDYRTGEAKLLE